MVLFLLGLIGVLAAAAGLGLAVYGFLLWFFDHKAGM